MCREAKPIRIQSDVCDCWALVDDGVLTYGNCGERSHEDQLGGTLRALALSGGYDFRYVLPDGRSGVNCACGCTWWIEDRILRVKPCGSEGHDEALLSVVRTWAADNELMLEVQRKEET